MDNDQLIDKIQNLLLGMEERSYTRFDRVEDRLGKVEDRLGVVDTKLESVRREVALHNELLTHSSTGATG